MRERIEISETGTLDTLSRYSRNLHGSIFGYAASPAANSIHRPQPRTEVRARPDGANRELVVVRSKCRAWLPRNFTHTLERIRELTVEKHGIRELSFQCTKHTFVTWALEAGEPPAAVARWVGTSVRTLLETSEHVSRHRITRWTSRKGVTCQDRRSPRELG